MNWEKFFENFWPGLVLLAISGSVWCIYTNINKILLWLKRFGLKMFPVKFNVGLSIDVNKGVNSGKYFHEINNNLKKIIDDLSLNRVVVVKDFSDIYAFKNKKEAENYRQKKNLNLLIWGEFSPDGLKSKGEIINRINLNFTYGYLKNLNDKDNKIGKAVMLDIGSRLATKNYWQIVESKSWDDIEIVSNNLVDISLYIIGFTLKLYGRLSESEEIFSKLYKKLTAREDNFKALVLPHLINCYAIFIYEIINTRKKYENGINYCKKILEIDENSHFALSNIATFYYKFGEKNKCEEVVEKLLRLYPKDPYTEVDVAFIRIIQGRYKNAYKHYNNLVNLGRITFNFQEVVEFLSIEYEKEKEPAMLYGAGIISYYWGDKLLAKQDFYSFIRDANERDYKEMYRNAKKLLNRLS